MGYVYLIENTIGEEVRYKIGFTKNLERRLKQLETGNPGDMHIIKYYESKWGRLIESSLHKLYLCDNVKNEWFMLDDEKIDIFIHECEKMEQSFDSMGDNFFFRKKYKL